MFFGLSWQLLYWPILTTGDETAVWRQDRDRRVDHSIADSVGVCLLWVVQRYGTVGGVVQPVRCETTGASAFGSPEIPISSRSPRSASWATVRRHSVYEIWNKKKNIKNQSAMHCLQPLPVNVVYCFVSSQNLNFMLFFFIKNLLFYNFLFVFTNKRTQQ